MANLDPTRIRLELITTELDLVGTFSRIARTSPNAETRRRNRAYAHEAYAMACRYTSELTTNRELIDALEERLSEARAELESLGKGDAEIAPARHVAHE
jgi:hypothetical protein